MKHICKSNRGDYRVLGEIETTPSDYIAYIYDRSRIAQKDWAYISVSDRLVYIRNFLDIYAQHKSNIAQMMCLEIAKPIAQCMADIDYDIGYIQWYIDHAVEILAPENIYSDDHGIHRRYWRPRGVASVISPWNYPSSQLIWQIIPPLIAGNTIIYKAASACMWTAKYICDLLISSLPSNVLNPIYGDANIGSAMISDHQPDMIIFTGSTAVGADIYNKTAYYRPSIHLELGGSAPGIILPGASIDTTMMETILYFRLRHAGQICDGLKRMIVHRSQMDELTRYIEGYFQNTKIGNPLDPDTQLGAMISTSALDHARAQISQAISMGARSMELGIYDQTPGAFLPFTLIYDATLDMSIMTEEVFAPVLPIIVYDDISTAIDIARHTKYGLGGYIWGSDLDQIADICRQIPSANFNINNTNYVIPQVPFGGGTISSGNTIQHGRDGLRAYSLSQTLSMPKI